MAGERSGAFTGCSGLGEILKGLEGRSEPTMKPMAVKRRKLAKAAAVPKAAVPKAAVPKAAVPKAAVPVAAVPVAAVPKAAVPQAPVAAVPVAAVPQAPADVPLSDTRKCVHSRAYKSAARVAKSAGLSPDLCTAAARKAGQEAAEKWDLEH